MKTDAKILAEIKELIRIHDDIATDKLLKLAQAVVDAWHYNGDDAWARLKDAIADLEEFIKPGP